jgi:hypothetical protein
MAYEDDACSLGRDVRRREATPPGPHDPLQEPDDGELEQRIAQRIEAIHCRLLESATAGRLTFQRDRIVPGPACARRAPIEPSAQERANAPAAARMRNGD